MERKIYKQLIDWKNSSSRKPLLLMGARQVGKTYIVKKFAKENYEDYIFINFEEKKGIESIFEGDLTPSIIISKIENLYNKRIYPNKTLIFFDEIRVSERAITSLKYFNEEANEYHIIAAGSLLGVALNRKKFLFQLVK